MEELKERIAKNLEDVRRRIEVACERCGRQKEEVTLIGVTKTFGPEVCKAAVEAGLLDLGENYAQELCSKAEAVRQMGLYPRWHFIGTLQSNKARLVAPIVASVQSVDRPSLVKELGKRVPEGRPLDIFVEVNVGKEPQKGGVLPEEAESLCRLVMEFPNLRLRGLMCIPPFSDDPEESRVYFRRLRELRDHLRSLLSPPEDVLKDLSMGMSHDFEVAIEEGATIVRVGTAIFGLRQKKGAEN